MIKERQLQVAADTEFALRLDLVLVVVLVIVFYVTQGTIVVPSRSGTCTHTRLVLIPGLATHPLQSIAGLIRANLDAGTLGSAHRFLYLKERERKRERVSL